MKTWHSYEGHTERIKAVVETGLTGQEKDGNPMPEEMSIWLAKLGLFYGVPFSYLVPDNRMLPLEAMRFFQVDSNWAFYLQDGALSIGRNTSAATAHDQAWSQFVCTQVGRERVKVRRILKLQSSLQNENLSQNISGFLLRSAIVEGWSGLEVQGFASTEESQTPLPILRLERVADNVLLCLFAGIVECVELKEPAEELHFGADEQADGSYTKMLRGLDVGNYPLGTPLDYAQSVTVPFREGAGRVLDIDKLVGVLQDGLSKAKALGPHFTAAEFAVEMVESAQMGVFYHETGDAGEKHAAK
ncbi:hypothetical protein SPSIL_041290 [Sporomusa silvacetica DSM 10669]|uniref:Uncharacterized protein n=1 Tax=Sporomusa silvacetica DSM 10669 TaxID=1123289 RepID=A0ABZ3IQH8_9FIRM|nr:hypothetical protein [Sporomusa silvacetica]OZC20391.1 hypothetical protein SPSIL_12580 [Sporomusa silvacetica DSM 10669]